jgi:hypothetical protein
MGELIEGGSKIRSGIIGALGREIPREALAVDGAHLVEGFHLGSDLVEPLLVTFPCLRY